MKTKTNTASAQSLQHLDPISRAACLWIAQHPRTANALILVTFAALAYVVYTYNFSVSA